MLASFVTKRAAPIVSSKSPVCPWLISSHTLISLFFSFYCWKQATAHYYPTMENTLIMNHSSDATTGTLVSEDSSLAMAEELAIGPKPKRPLSAYNFFFAWERQQILERRQVREEGKPKRSHGKCGFAQMERSVAQKWNKDEIDPEIKRMFEEKAKIEKIRYNQEMDAWKKRRTEYRRNHGSPKNNNKKKKAAKEEESPNKFTGVSSSSPAAAAAAAATVSNNSSPASFLSQQEQQSSTEFMHNQMQGNTMMMLNIMSPMNYNNSMTSSNNHNGGVMIISSGPSPADSAPLQNAALLQSIANANNNMNNNTPPFMNQSDAFFPQEPTPPPPTTDLHIQRLANTMDRETMELFIDIMKTA